MSTISPLPGTSVSMEMVNSLKLIIDPLYNLLLTIALGCYESDQSDDRVHVLLRQGGGPLTSHPHTGIPPQSQAHPVRYHQGYGPNRE